MAKKKTYNATLSVSSLQDLQKRLRDYQKSLEEKCRRLAELLAEDGVSIAKIQITTLDAVFTGELLASIHSESKGITDGRAVFCVVADSSHAAYVEFGTGIIGESSPYPYELPDGVTWEYASGKTIRQLADGRYGWFYPGNDGKWYFTEGMPSRPFMNNTAMELQRKILARAKEVFE